MFVSIVSAHLQVEALVEGNGAAGTDGLIGLGPSSGSSVRALGNSAAANLPLDRIFTSNASDDPQEPYPGDLTVGDILTDYQDILNQPWLPVTITPLQGGQHW